VLAEDQHIDIFEQETFEKLQTIELEGTEDVILFMNISFNQNRIGVVLGEKGMRGAHEIT